MDPLEELRGFIDNDQFVSFRWFANCLDIHVESAKTILTTFKETNKDVCATYCVSGLLKNQQQSISIVPESSLTRCKELFSVINCVHVYSIQKIKFLESSSISAQLNAADVQQANELTALQTVSMSFLLNGLGGIKMDGSDVKPVGQRVSPPVRAAIVPSSSSDISAEGQMMKSFAKAGNNKDKTAAASSSSAKDNKDQDKKASAIATSFFATTASSSSAKAVPEKKKPAAKETAAKIKAKPAEKVEKVEKVVNVKGGDADDNDDEWTEEGAASYKPDKKKLKSDKSNLPASSSGSAQVDLDLTSSQSTTEDSQPTDSEPVDKTKKYVHGAMDDYMEDVAIEEFKAQEALGGSAEGLEGVQGVLSEGGKRTKKKLVEKMFADAKGYLVTEMVWEDVEISDSEDVPVKAIKTNTSNSNSTNKRPIETEADEDKDGELVIKKGGAKAPAKKAAKKSAPVVQQKGMMSFFGKK